MALCTALNIPIHEHHDVVGIDKAALKAKMRALKKDRDAAIEAGDHDEAEGGAPQHPRPEPPDQEAPGLARCSSRSATHRTPAGRPYVTYALIAANVLVYVLVSLPAGHAAAPTPTSAVVPGLRRASSATSCRRTCRCAPRWRTRRRTTSTSSSTATSRPRRRSPTCSSRCSSTAGSCTSSGTCCSCGSTATTWSTASAGCRTCSWYLVDRRRGDAVLRAVRRRLDGAAGGRVGRDLRRARASTSCGSRATPSGCSCSCSRSS